MAGSTDDFSYLSNDVGNVSIALANGETLPWIGRGTVSLPSGFLSKVFHVPGLDKNLLSFLANCPLERGFPWFDWDRDLFFLRMCLRLFISFLIEMSLRSEQSASGINGISWLGVCRYRWKFGIWGTGWIAFDTV
jgi:hypothetical protein